MGTITVGPVTMTMAPNRVLTCHEKLNISWVATVTMTQVVSAPTVIIRCTTLLTSRISPSFSVRLPSNRMIATDRATIGCRVSRNNWSGLIHPNTGPTSMPAMSRNKIAGRRARQASHWESVATSSTSEIASPKSCMGVLPACAL
jgi:hypothetical protein